MAPKEQEKEEEGDSDCSGVAIVFTKMLMRVTDLQSHNRRQAEKGKHRVKQSVLLLPLPKTNFDYDLMRQQYGDGFFFFLFLV